MTYSAIYRLSLIMFVCILMGCHDTRKWNGIEFSHTESGAKMNTMDMKSVDTTDMMFAEEELVFDVRLDLDFMEPKNENDSMACAEINRYIITTLLECPDTMTQKQAVDAYIERTKKEFKNNEYQLSCTDYIKGIAEYGKEGVINYTMTEDYYGGGAHPTQVVMIHRFSSLTGRRIGLWDVFEDTCSNTIKEMLTERLMEQVGVETTDELHEKGYLEMTDMFIPENFWMNKDSISFFFNQYDIAPYAVGQTVLSFSYDELKKVMR